MIHQKRMLQARRRLVFPQSAAVFIVAFAIGIQSGGCDPCDVQALCGICKYAVQYQFCDDCKALIPSTCGNGEADRGEECDPSATPESSEEMSRWESAECDADCTNRACGDGYVNLVAGEACDEGANNLRVGSNEELGDNEVRCLGSGFKDKGLACTLLVCGDGICLVEAGESELCQEDCPCGNAEVEGAEQCDPGNNAVTKECDPDCSLPVCGDDVLNMAAGEFCESGDENSNAWDMAKHCNADCSGWAPYCGDGNCDAQENAASCSSDCSSMPPACGNGVPEEGEECDDGNMDDTDTCVADCKNAKCGDGFVRAREGESKEECDDGNMNNDDACLNTCKLAFCGDGFVQAGVDECDDGNDDNGDECSKNCELPRRVFVTSDGNLFKGNLGGLAGADMKCRNLAFLAGLPNPMVYRAWLSDGVESPATRFKAAQPDTLFKGKYVLVDGVTAIALNGWEDLIDDSLEYAINIDENGVGGVKSSPWTNTAGNGASLGANHCDNWTSMEGFPKVGAFGSTGFKDVSWTHVGMGTLPCDVATALYCFEDR